MPRTTATTTITTMTTAPSSRVALCVVSLRRRWCCSVGSKRKTSGSSHFVPFMLLLLLSID
uniref:Uncharacterized protein n=1 Tax=Arundo donax TaxID=35708 RepID=A0A0A9AU61_ARUDO